MSWVRFQKSAHKDFEVEGAPSLMSALRSQGIPVASSCLGKGTCGKCRMWIQAQDLPVASEFELQTLQNSQAPEGTRLSCQIACDRDLTVHASYW